jgi:hypothetical protein
MLARKELAAVLSVANKKRNDWAGHGGIVSEADARLRNEQLLAELYKSRLSQLRHSSVASNRNRALSGRVCGTTL